MSLWSEKNPERWIGQKKGEGERVSHGIREGREHWETIPTHKDEKRFTSSDYRENNELSNGKIIT